MTLILSVHGKDFVVLASDTRGTDQYGDGSRLEVNKVQKIWPAGKFVRILFSGDGDYAFNLYDLFRARFGTDHAGVRDAADHLAQVCREDARQLRSVPGAFEGSGVGFIVAGLDISRAGPTPMSFRIATDTGYKLELVQVGYCMDGKTHIPKYLFTKLYNPPMAVDALTRLASHAVFEVGTIDSDVGGTVQVSVIDVKGCRTLTPKAVRQMLSDPITTPPESDRPIEEALGIKLPGAPTPVAKPEGRVRKSRRPGRGENRKAGP